MATKEKGKENAYEQKIKEEDERRERQLKAYKAMVKGAIITGLMVAVPLILLGVYIIYDLKRAEKEQVQMRTERERLYQLERSRPKYPLKRLNH